MCTGRDICREQRLSGQLYSCVTTAVPNEELEGISAAELRLRLMGLYLSSERWISRMWRVYHRELRTHCLSRSVCFLS